MKYVLLPCLLLATLVSCQKKELVSADVDGYPQTWQLVKTSGQIPNSVKTGADMPMQETYVFQADSTFIKTRHQNGQLTEGRGVFTFQDFSDGRYMVLTYAAASPIIGACTTEPKETLALKNDDTLVSTWQNCDGPGLEYQKVKVTRTQ